MTQAASPVQSNSLTLRVCVRVRVRACVCTQHLAHLSGLEGWKSPTVVGAPLKQPEAVSASRGSETALQAKVCL